MHDPHSAVTVRERRDADLHEVAAVLVAVHGSDGYPVEGVADPIAWLTGGPVLRAWVGELGGKIIGHVSISSPQSGDAAARLWSEAPRDCNSSVGVLGRLFVISSARGRAVGELLIRAATTYADEIGVRLVLDVMAKDVSAIRLYERLGWKRIGVTSHAAGQGNVIPAVCYVAPRAGIARSEGGD